jgi:hypothetical protein
LWACSIAHSAHGYFRHCCQDKLLITTLKLFRPDNYSSLLTQIK